MEASLANSVVAEKDRATFQEQTIVAPEASRAVAVEKSLANMDGMLVAKNSLGHNDYFLFPLPPLAFPLLE